MEWRKELYQFESTPPDIAWENIRKELDSDVPKIRELLADYKQQPPTPVWDAITNELDRTEKTPVIWYRRPSVATAAAASIAAIILLYTYFFSGSNGFSVPDISASVYKTTVEPTRPEPTDNRDHKDSQKQTLAVLQPGTNDIAPVPGTIPSGPGNWNASSITLPSDPVSLSLNTDDENYIYLLTNSGEVKRVSYKLEKMIAEIRKQDGEKLRKWTGKLEKSAFIPAGNNFFDIAEMVKIMSEERP